MNINVNLSSFSVASWYPTPFRNCLWQFGSFLLSVCPPRNTQLHKTLQTWGSRRNHVTWKANVSESNWIPLAVKLSGDHGLDPPELPARWWKDTMYLTLSLYYANFLGPVQLVISKGAVKCWIETLLESLSVSSFLPKSWIWPWECICLFFPCHQPAFGWKL